MLRNRKLSPDEVRAKIHQRELRLPMVTRRVPRSEMLDYAAHALAVILLGVLILGALYAPLVFDVYTGR